MLTFIAHVLKLELQLWANLFGAKWVLSSIIVYVVVSTIHTHSEIKRLKCLLKLPSFAYVWNMKTLIDFFHVALLHFSPNEYPGIVKA